MKPLTVRIAERVAATYPPSSPATNLAKFILLREEILQAIEGYGRPCMMRDQSTLAIKRFVATPRDCYPYIAAFNSYCTPLLTRTIVAQAFNIRSNTIVSAITS